jgi:hypothetical protein
MFIARNQGIYLSLPLQSPTEFSFSPILVPSKRERLDSIEGKIQIARGSLKQGDKIILASDALAAWIMKQALSDRLAFLEIIQSIKKAKDDFGFTRWINILRRSGELKNDDTSVIYIELDEKNDGSR